METAKSLYVSRNGMSYLRIRRAAWDLVSTYFSPPFMLLAQVTLHKGCSHWSSVLKSSWPRKAAANGTSRCTSLLPAGTEGEQIPWELSLPAELACQQLCHCPLPQEFLLKRKVVFHNSRSARCINKVVHKNYLETYSTLLCIQKN